MGLDCIPKPDNSVLYDPFYDPCFDLDRAKPIDKSLVSFCDKEKVDAPKKSLLDKITSILSKPF